MQRARANPSRNANHESGVELLHAAAVACPHGLMIEERGRVQYANPAYARLAGLDSSHQAIGQEVAKLTVPAPSASKHVGATQLPSIYDTLRFEFRHGTRRVILHVVRDITERRVLEARLRESEKMESLGRLVGGVTHDFSNILTAVSVHTDLLEQRLGQRMRELEQVRQATARGGDLVRQLLTFARQQPSAPRIVSLRETVMSMSAVLTPLMGGSVSLVTDFARGGDFVRVDPAQLQQVILNLVLNARDALPQSGRIMLRTRTCKLNDHEANAHGITEGRYIRLVVEDDGCGMSEQVRARIFDPFFTTKARASGTGLGMSMVYGIVTHAGGAVAVASKLGRGTKVSIFLPEAPRVREGSKVTGCTHKERTFFAKTNAEPAATVAFPEAPLSEPFSRTALEPKVRKTIEERRLASRRRTAAVP